MSKVKLEESHVYLLEYKLQAGNGSWYRYEAVMTYLGKGSNGDLLFNLRPVAGTQTLPKDAILGADDLGPSRGWDDSRHRQKRSLGRLPRADRD